MEAELNMNKIDLILYGIGLNVEKVYVELKDKHNIVCFTDKDKAKHGMKVKMSDGNEYVVLPLRNALRKFSEAKLWIVPKSPLKYEIMYELLNGTHIDIKIDEKLIQNFEYDTYRHYYPFNSFVGPIVAGNNILYVEDNKCFEEACKKSYRLDGGGAEEVRIIEKGMILPAKFAYDGYLTEGGVYDAEGNHIDGHLRVMRDDLPPCQVQGSINHVQETVVYGGVIFNHFGHMITESLSRMWWLLENRNCGHKFVFISYDDSNSINFIDYLLLLGLEEEDIVLLKEPIKFDLIIVPVQTTYLFTGFEDKAIAIYNTIRDSVVPASYDKIYLTRTKFQLQDTVNEEYFENYYRSIGYEIIAMEQLSIREQTSIMAGAKSVVCTSGTLQHHILFSHDGVSITVLNRSNHFKIPIRWINQVRNAKCTFIDVHKNFLPVTSFGMAWLLMPTVYWKRYVKDSGGKLEEKDVYEPTLYLKYIEIWVKRIIYAVRNSEQNLGFLKNFTLADVITGLYNNLLECHLDEPTKEKLYSAFLLDANLTIKHSDSIWIWGAGHYGVLTVLDYEQKDIKVEGFIDINAKQIKKRLGLPVLEPDNLMKKNGISKPKIIIAVSNPAAVRKIIAYLKEADLKENEDFECLRIVRECIIKDYFIQLDKVNRRPEIRKIINFLSVNPFAVYPYDFIHKYKLQKTFYDKDSEMYYVLHNNKKLYMPSDYSDVATAEYYRSLCIEQDVDSPHKYETEGYTVKNGDVIADLGAAEGLWGLENVEKASKVYLFECNEKWIKALKKTFEPWNEKVDIINKFVSNTTQGNNVALDDFFKEQEINFLKADIEGAEIKLLQGAETILKNRSKIKLLLCVYHKENDELILKEMLDKYGLVTEYSRNYMLFSYDKNLKEPYIRRGLIRGKK